MDHQDLCEKLTTLNYFVIKRNASFGVIVAQDSVIKKTYVQLDERYYCNVEITIHTIMYTKLGFH